jgi:hypothetical protein
VDHRPATTIWLAIRRRGTRLLAGGGAGGVCKDCDVEACDVRERERLVIEKMDQKRWIDGSTNFAG